MDRICIEEWLEKYKVKNYIINEDLSVDVSGDVVLSRLLVVCIVIIII